MRKLSILVSALALVVLFASPLAVAAQEDPAAVLTAMAEGASGGDVEAQLAMFADDAVVTAPGDGPDGVVTYTGKDEIRVWLEADSGDEAGPVVLGEITVDGATASATFTRTVAALEELGLNPLMGSVELTTAEGLITAFTITPDPEWVARANEVFAAMAAEGEGEAVAEGEGVAVAEGEGEGMQEEMGDGEGMAEETAGGGEDMGGKGPGELPATGDAGDPLPLALAAGLGLLMVGVALRRSRQAA